MKVAHFFLLVFVVSVLFSSHVTASEYSQGDTTKTFILLLNESGGVENNASCEVKAWFPNGSVLYGWTNATLLDNGTYMFEYTLLDDAPLGLYPLIWKCNVSGVVSYPSGGGEYNVQLAREGRPFTLSTESFFLFLGIFLFIFAVFAQKSYVWVFAAGFHIIQGLFMIPVSGFAVGFVLVCIGMVELLISWDMKD